MPRASYPAWKPQMSIERPASKTLRLVRTDMLRVSELVVSVTYKDRTKVCLASRNLFLLFHLAYLRPSEQNIREN